MRIGIDASCWVSARGYGRFTRELVAAMVMLAPDDEFVCFAADQDIPRIDLRAPNVSTVAVRQSVPPATAAAAEGSRSPLDMARFTLAVLRRASDVFFFPSVYTYFPLPPRRRAVVTIHDAIAERFPHLTLPSARARLFWNAKVRLALRQCRLVLTVSEFAADELTEVLRIPRRRLRVTGEAPAAAYAPSEPDAVRDAARRIGLPDGARWFTYVGGFNPHKRLDVILRAHARLVRDAPEAAPYLVLVGPSDRDVFHQDVGALRDELRDAGTEHLVLRPGFLPDEDLRHLHAGAAALLLVSEAEGFGLPAVEAAACGTPVIGTTRSPLPRLLAGGGIFVEPGDVPAVTHAMRRLLTEPELRRTLGLAARARAAALSWRSSGEAALSALREAAA